MYENEVDHSSLEVGKVTAYATVNEESGNMLSRFERFSNHQRLKTAIAIRWEYKKHLRMSVSTADNKPLADKGPRIYRRSCDSESSPTIMVRGLEQAQVVILKLVQTSAFDKEVKSVKQFQAETEGVRKDWPYHRFDHPSHP